MTGASASSSPADVWTATGRLVLLAVGLLLAAFIGGVALVVVHGLDYGWDDRALVRVDGRPHTVELRGDTATMVWAYSADAAPRCAVTDATTGALLPLSPVTGEYRRDGGSAGDWVGTMTFRTRSSDASLTCAGPGSLVAVEAKPFLPPPLAILGPWGAVPAALAVMGLLAGFVGLSCAARCAWNSVDRRGKPTANRGNPAADLCDRSGG